MQPLNAIDAIAPAFTRSHEVLFRPFRAGRSWKLAASSYLAYGGSMFVPFPLLLLFVPREVFASQPRLLSVVWAAAAITFVVYAVFFYCCIRMEFVEFEMVVTRSKFVAPMWRRYGARAWPWFLLKVVGGTVIFTAFAPLAIKVLRGMMGSSLLLREANSGAVSDPAMMIGMLHALFGFYAVVFGLIFALKLFGTLLNDFVLPFYALEPIGLATAVQRGVGVLTRDPLHVLLYLLLKPVLATVGFIMLEIAILLCIIPLGIVAFLLAFLGAGLAHVMSGAAAHLVLIVGGGLLYLVCYAAFLALIIGLVGYLMNLLEAYGIYFLGGRYAMLGNLLEPGPGMPFTPPPVPPSPEELEDDDNEPPMPMDPAIA